MLTQSNSSKKKKLSKSEINKTNLTVDRGVELILKGRKKGGIPVDTNIILIISLPIAFLLYTLGIVSGWLIRDYMMNYREIPKPHPEMFDMNGNLVPDEIVAFRFENYDSNEEDDD